MNSIYVIETLIAVVFFILQMTAYQKTKKKIHLYQNIFPKKNIFNVLTYYINEEVARANAIEALVMLENYYPENAYDNSNDVRQEQVKFDEYRMLRERTVKTTELMSLKSTPNFTLAIIVNALNAYLLKNKGFASDYKLIKDIVERNTRKVFIQIKKYINIPIYLGIIGALIIILFSLFLYSGFNIFLQSKIATPTAGFMVLTNTLFLCVLLVITGSVFTYINSAVELNKAYSIFEARKNDFYTLLQTELLPALNRNINSTFESLQKNLNSFNDRFDENIENLTDLINKNLKATRTQAETLAMIESTDNMEFAKANLIVLKELQLTTERYSEFNRYLDTVNQMMIESRGYTQKINEMIARTEDFKNLGQHIIETFQHNQSLIDFLQQHYNSLDESRQLIYNSVGKVNTTLNESLETLKTFAKAKIQEVQKIIDNETYLLHNKIFTENNYSDKKQIDYAQKPLPEQVEELKVEIEYLTQKLSLAKEKMNELNTQTENNGVSGFLRNLFKGKK